MLHLLEKISQLAKNRKRILVLGDMMLDYYEYGEVTKISPEAPVQVVKFKDSKYVLGGAANVANNLAALGAEVWAVGIMGNDENSEILKKCIDDAKINSEGIFTETTRPTIVKKRIVSGKNQLLRVDYEQTHPINQEVLIKLKTFLQNKIGLMNAVVISDYDKGLLTKELSQFIINLANEYKIPIIADGKPQNMNYYANVTIIKPNLKEAREMTGINDDSVEKMSRIISEKLNSHVFITMGDKGIYLFEKNGKELLVPTKRVHVYDVTGAGDTVTAITALGFANKLSIQDIAELANIAGRIVVQKPGTATATLDEIKQTLDSISIRESYERHEKEWGHEEWIVNLEGAGYCSKKLVLNEGYQCSIHYHKEKDEVFYINKGYVLIIVDGKEYLMKPGARIRIEPGTRHRFIGLTNAEIFEISTYHKEEDSYREEPSGKVDLRKFEEYLNKYRTEIKL